MTISIRDGMFDVAIVAGPGISNWPSAGVRAISALCAEAGLSVGMFGPDSLEARGVVPLSGTGGLILAEDRQQRIHRIRARAIVRVAPLAALPDPFPGWRSQGLIPLATAVRLLAQGRISWTPVTVILGTGNRALRFGSDLLGVGVHKVYCIETCSQWGTKRFAAWEVERRRFEMLGGEVLEARPVSLQSIAALQWALRLEGPQGVRVIETARVVSAGPFRDLPGLREYPPGSFLFELEQTAPAERIDDQEGWALEEERGRWLACKVIKALTRDLAEHREKVEKIHKRARLRLKKFRRHYNHSFVPTYEGKWVSPGVMEKLRAFPGVPKQAHRVRPIASIECLEEVGCKLCQVACPEDAIEIARRKGKFLKESDCTACGICLRACPSATPVLVHEQEDRSFSKLTLAWDGRRQFAVGDFAALVNRRGEYLGSARVSALVSTGSEAPSPKALTKNAGSRQLVQVDVPTHLLWEARGVRPLRTDKNTDESASAPLLGDSEPKVEITLNGEKRLVRDGIPISLALFEMGYGRPEDVLFCPDGSCGLCQISVDGSKKPACKTLIRRGMSIRTEIRAAPRMAAELCPCQGVTREQVVERMRQGKLHSPEAVLSVTHVGEGKCHGQLCSGAFRRVLLEEGLDSEQWIDWRFPWMDWVLIP